MWISWWMTVMVLKKERESEGEVSTVGIRDNRWVLGDRKKVLLGLLLDWSLLSLVFEESLMRQPTTFSHHSFIWQAHLKSPLTKWIGWGAGGVLEVFFKDWSSIVTWFEEDGKDAWADHFSEIQLLKAHIHQSEPESFLDASCRWYAVDLSVLGGFLAV